MKIVVSGLLLSAAALVASTNASQAQLPLLYAPCKAGYTYDAAKHMCVRDKKEVKKAKKAKKAVKKAKKK